MAWPSDTIDKIKFGASTGIFIPHKYQGEKGRYLQVLDSLSMGTAAFKNLTYSLNLDSGNFSGDTLQIPDNVFNTPGLIKGKIYGTGGQASTVLKTFYFVVREVPKTNTSLSITSEGDTKTIKLNGQHQFNFLWNLNSPTSYPKLVIDDDTSYRSLEVWSDSNPSIRYTITSNNNTFAIPTTGASKDPSKLYLSDVFTSANRAKLGSSSQTQFDNLWTFIQNNFSNSNYCICVGCPPGGNFNSDRFRLTLWQGTNGRNLWYKNSQGYFCCYKSGGGVVSFDVYDKGEFTIAPASVGSSSASLLSYPTTESYINYLPKVCKDSGGNYSVAVCDSTLNSSNATLWCNQTVRKCYDDYSIIFNSNILLTAPSATYLGTSGTFHGLLRFGDGESTDTVAAEFIWNFC